MLLWYGGDGDSQVWVVLPLVPLKTLSPVLFPRWNITQEEKSIDVHLLIGSLPIQSSEDLRPCLYRQHIHNSKPQYYSDIFNLVNLSSQRRRCNQDLPWSQLLHELQYQNSFNPHFSVYKKSNTINCFHVACIWLVICKKESKIIQPLLWWPHQTIFPPEGPKTRRQDKTGIPANEKIDCPPTQQRGCISDKD